MQRNRMIRASSQSFSARADGRGPQRPRIYLAIAAWTVFGCLWWAMVTLRESLHFRQPHHQHIYTVRELDAALHGHINTADDKEEAIQYPDMKDLIFDLFELGSRDPAALRVKLEDEDPFEVLRESPDGFDCPDILARVDHQSVVDEKASGAFRAGEPNSLLFYQHLRKAGGTGFCDTARNNMPKGSTPPYYCMPDNRGSLATPPWGNTTYLLEQLHKKGHRMVANEWDVIYDRHFFIPNVVLATTFRHPIDRWYSQYRFEHLEHRDGSTAASQPTPFPKWYDSSKSWTMGTNYYVSTFEGTEDGVEPKHKGDFYWTYHKFWNKPMTWDMFAKATLNIRRFHLILITEWLDSSSVLLNRVLGWHVPPKQVLPHESQALRDTHRSVGARASLSEADYNRITEENIFDLLFFHIVKRIYLERLICE